VIVEYGQTSVVRQTSVDSCELTMVDFLFSVNLVTSRLVHNPFSQLVSVPTEYALTYLIEC